MINLKTLDKFRLTGPEIRKRFGNDGNHQNGCFIIKSPIDNAEMMVIASVGAGWEHLSISRRNRCPNWPEMEHTKRMFFKDDETTMQLHVPIKKHLSAHPYCLHIWRPINAMIPMPPEWMVAPPKKDENK